VLCGPGQGEGSGDAGHVALSLVTQSGARVPHPQMSFLSGTRPPRPAARPLRGVGGAAVWPLS